MVLSGMPNPSQGPNDHSCDGIDPGPSLEITRDAEHMKICTSGRTSYNNRWRWFWRCSGLCGKAWWGNEDQRSPLTHTIGEFMSSSSRGVSGPSGRTGLQPVPGRLFSESYPMPGSTLTQTPPELSTGDQIKRLTVRFLIDSFDLIRAHNLRGDNSTRSKRSWRRTRYHSRFMYLE